MATLSESEAMALLTQHTAELRDIKYANIHFTRNSDWANAAQERVTIVALPAAISEGDVRVKGARLRLAFGVAYAVSCCRGFAPQTRRAFWRRAIATLWPGLYQYASGANVDMSPSLFAHVAVEWMLCDDEAFWSGFLHGTPACVAALATVMDALTPYLVSAPLPPLRVSLARCNAGIGHEPAPLPDVINPYPVVTPTALKMLLRAALNPPLTTPAWTTRTHLGLVLDYRIDEPTHVLLDVVARCRPPPHLSWSIDRLALQLSPAANHDVATRTRTVGLLLQTFAPHIETLALSGCSHSDVRVVGAALSAVAMALQPLATLRCSGLFVTTCSSRDRRNRLAWLVFALLCRQRRWPDAPPLALSLLSFGFAVLDDEAAVVMTAVVDRGTPLCDVIRAQCCDDGAVECLPIGSTVRFARGTRLTLEPFTPSDNAVIVVTDEDFDLDWVAFVSSTPAVVSVVAPGYGLLWALAQCVIASHEPTDLVATRVAVASLALHFEGMIHFPNHLEPHAIRVSALLPFFASPSLRTLTFHRALVARDDLTMILSRAPLLESLAFDSCVVESIEPLVHAFASRASQIATLSLVRVRDVGWWSTVDGTKHLRRRSILQTHHQDGDVPVWIPSFLHTLACGVARGVLQDLDIDVTGMASIEHERAAIETLATIAQSLTRVRVACRYRLGDDAARVLVPLDNVALADRGACGARS